MQLAVVRHAGTCDLSSSWRRNSTVELMVVVAALLTGLASYYRDTLTQREQVFGPEDNGTAYASFQYGDETNDGSSTVAVTGGNGLAWTCDLRMTYQYGYCGFGLIFDQYHTGRGLDLTRFDSAIFTLDYEGSGESLRLVFKDKSPRYVELGAPDDEKVNQASIAISPGRHTVKIDLNQFSVAEWWKEGAQPTDELTRTRFDNVTSMEFITAADSEEGQQSLQIDKIAFTGQTMSAETWYSGVAVVWLLLIGAILFVRRGENRKWQRQLVESMQTTFDTIPHMVWSLDANGKASFNRRWKEFTGKNFGPSYWRELQQLVHPEDLRSAIKQWNAGIRLGAEFNIEFRISPCSGHHRWVLARAVPFRNDEGKVTGWYGTCTDIDDRVIAQQALHASIEKERRRSKQLKWTSEHDPLTRLPNRRAFEAKLDNIILDTVDNENTIGLLLVDLDYFKHTNDTMGHAAGDRLLRELAARLKQSVRRQDFVARIGGDEFAVILPGLRNDADLVAIGSGVAATIQLALNIGDHVVRPSASVGGAACWRGGELEAGELLMRADAALYDLKRSARGGFRMFESYMLDDVKKAAFQLARAREAIVDCSITAVYQPKVSIEGGAVAGFEALLRLRRPDGTLGLPDTLAEAFNDYELATKIGEAMQVRVIRDVRGWLDAGLAFGHVSINAAPAEFLRNDYAERLLDVLDRNGVPPSCIEVEVTEHVFVELGREYVARALDRLKSAGVAISLDDFGTGHSSLSYIRDFPVDLIKIDRSYTKLISQDDEIAALVMGLVHLARSLGLKVVAEGVETTQQLELLRAMGCHLAQGHLLGHPVESQQVPTCVAERATLVPNQLFSSQAA
ncbi:EAL domain-containing protein [Altererythrobacter salegens]|uniref:EAL domain-containing protein n=1 Tax=Croceibacterium salegens TaxID=1737568 RepID=A0A6I4SZB9_9SPHN|nr:GGDEF domain-containing phosphodiesterase [Croceibacterium salegens]MXO60377.1 EAL domain-containing protein [Croceibacterium salegens]